MPYIKQEDRERLDLEIINLSEKIMSEGELNYVMTCLCHNYIKRHGLRYHNIARVSGVINNVGSEFYRKVAAPYEEEKIKENGDVNILG